MVVRDGVSRLLSTLQVALLCGLDAAGKKEVAKGAAHGGSHLHNLLKFLTVRSERDGKRGGIALLGGPLDIATDGDTARSAHTSCNQPPAAMGMP